MPAVFSYFFCEWVGVKICGCLLFFPMSVFHTYHFLSVYIFLFSLLFVSWFLWEFVQGREELWDVRGVWFSFPKILVWILPHTHSG